MCTLTFWDICWTEIISLPYLLSLNLFLPNKFIRLFQNLLSNPLSLFLKFLFDGRSSRNQLLLMLSHIILLKIFQAKAGGLFATVNTSKTFTFNHHEKIHKASIRQCLSNWFLTWVYFHISTGPLHIRSKLLYQVISIEVLI